MRNARFFRWGLAALALGLVGCGGGQALHEVDAAEAMVPKVDLEKERVAVRQVIDEFYDAAEQQDWDRISALMTDDFRLFADGATVFTKKPYLEILESEDLGVLEMALNDLEIHVASGGDTAWCTFNGYFKHSEELEVETAETLIFVKQEGAWKILHSHASVKMLGEEESAA